MALQTVSGSSALIKDVVNPRLCNSVFHNRYFLKMFPREPDALGSTYDVKHVVSGTTGTDLFAEGDAAPSAVAGGYQTANMTYQDVRVVFGMTGDQERAVGSNGAGTHFAGMDVEARLAIEALRDLMETTHLADQTYGLLGMVDDDTTTIGSIDRGTYTALKSLVVAGGSATLTHAKLNDCFFGMQEDPYLAAGGPELILSSAKQIQLYHQSVLGSPNNDGGANGDRGFMTTSLNGVPWLSVPNFVNTEIVMLKGINDGSIFWVNHETRAGAFEVNVDESESIGKVYLKEYASSKDETTYQATMSGALIVLFPAAQAKIEALATS